MEQDREQAFITTHSGAAKWDVTTVSSLPSHRDVPERPHVSIHNHNGSPTCSEHTAEDDLHNQQHVRGPRWARSLPLLWSVMWLNNDAFASRQCPNVPDKGGKSLTAKLAFRMKLKAAPVCFKNFKTLCKVSFLQTPVAVTFCETGSETGSQAHQKKLC